MPKIEIDVVAGLCRLEFTPGSSTGRDPDTNPGVAFMAISDVPGFKTRDGKFAIGSGVISRTDAALLRDELEIFLKESERTLTP